MPIPSSKAVAPVDTRMCPACTTTAIRDEALLDALQMARFVLTSSTVPLDAEARLERAKLAINEAMRLMQPVRW